MQKELKSSLEIRADVSQTATEAQLHPECLELNGQTCPAVWTFHCLQMLEHVHLVDEFIQKK